MARPSRQGILVGLTAGLVLAAAGAFAFSLGSIQAPAAADLPVVRVASALEPAPETPPVAPVAETTATVTPPVETPAAPTAGASGDREVIVPDVREEAPAGSEHDPETSDSDGERESTTRESTSHPER